MKASERQRKMQSQLLSRSWKQVAVLASALFLWPMIGTQASAGDVKQKVYSICELEAAHASLNGKVVRVKAIYRYDGLEMSGLFDQSCRGVSMALYTPSTETAHESVRNFDEATYRGTPGAGGVFEIEVTGLFRWDDSPGDRHFGHLGLAVPRGRLDITRVWTFARWE